MLADILMYAWPSPCENGKMGSLNFGVKEVFLWRLILETDRTFLFFPFFCPCLHEKLLHGSKVLCTSSKIRLFPAVSSGLKETRSCTGQVYLSLGMLSADGCMCEDSCDVSGSVAVWALRACLPLISPFRASWQGSLPLQTGSAVPTVGLSSTSFSFPGYYDTEVDKVETHVLSYALLPVNRSIMIFWVGTTCLCPLLQKNGGILRDVMSWAWHFTVWFNDSDGWTWLP